MPRTSEDAGEKDIMLPFEETFDRPSGLEAIALGVVL